MSENRILNWQRQPKDERDFKSVRHLSAPLELPSEFELDRQIPIYDQKSIGSCTANSACSCFRYEVAQLTNNFDFEPSRLFQYYNSRALQGWENEDSGAYIRDAFKAMNKWGLCLESLWPYDDTLAALVKKPTSTCYENGLKNVAVKYASVDQNLEKIKQTLVSGAAVSFGFDVYSSFFGSWHSTTGMMPIPKSNESLQGGHAITCIGFSDSKQAFLIQNSWGTSWGTAAKPGRGGYFWMPYSYALNPSKADDFWCIEEVKVEGANPVPPKPSEIAWLDAAKILFKTSKELYAVKKPTIIRLGQALGLPVDANKKFDWNFDILKKKLEL